MKRFREVVFSATVPEDRNVIWIFPVTKDIDNDLKDNNLPVEAFNEELYKVMIWGLDDWVNLFHGSLFYMKAQLLSLLGDVPEGKTVIQVIGELENVVDLNIREVQILNNALTVLEGIVSNKVDKIEGKELSDENFTSTYKNLLDTLTGGYMTFKDIVDTLPESANNGDVYIVEQTVGEETKYLGYIWSDVQDAFLPLGNVTNFSNFYTKSETYSKQEVEGRITNALNSITITQKSSPQEIGYWRGSKLYPMLVDPLANVANHVNLGGVRGVLNFYSMHEYFNIAFNTMECSTELKIGGNNGGSQLTGILSLYNNTKQGYTYLTGGEGASNKTYKLPSAATDGGETILATIAPATTEKAGLMSSEDKNTLNNLAGGNIPIGGIIMWSGKEDTIDTTHWALCNGQIVNGYTTPDLRGRFIMSSTYGETISIIPRTPTGEVREETIQSSIGDSSKTSPIRVNGSPVYGYYTHTITGNEIKHTHNVETRTTRTKYRDDDLTVIKDKNPSTSENKMNTIAQNPTSFVPPYYVLAFIMRIA